MKNGVSIAGMSEIMHEIKGDTAEGIFSYAAWSEWSGGETLAANVAPAVIGTVKSSRGFGWRVALGDKAAVSDVCQSDWVFLPEELALAGLGSCALLTMVKGASTRGSSLEHLCFKVKAVCHRQPEDKVVTALTDFDYRVEFEADAAGENQMFQEILTKLSNHSPNHRTIAEANTVSLCQPVKAEIAEMAPVSAADSQTEIRVDVHWEYGFQLHAAYADGLRRLKIDQPKQAGGIDKGANPQEILLASLVACLTRTLVAHAEQANILLDGVRVDASGHVDMRGMLGIAPEVPSKLQNISLNFSLDSHADQSALHDLIYRAAESSPILRLLVEKQRIALHLYRGETFITEFISEG